MPFSLVKLKQAAIVSTENLGKKGTFIMPRRIWEIDEFKISPQEIALVSVAVFTFSIIVMTEVAVQLFGEGSRMIKKKRKR